MREWGVGSGNCGRGGKDGRGRRGGEGDGECCLKI